MKDTGPEAMLPLCLLLRMPLQPGLIPKVDVEVMSE
jgi:hypothetical protein